jgi:hypothetical protein
MTLAKKVARLCLALAVVSKTCCAEEKVLQEKKISLEHLSNGLTYCLSQEDSCEDQLSIQLLIKFEDSQFTKKEHYLAQLTQDYIMQALCQKPSCSNPCFAPERLKIETPKVFYYPHITLYKMHLKQPTQQDLDGFLSTLSRALDSLSLASLCDWEDAIISSHYNQEHNLDQGLLTAQDLKDFTSLHYTFEKMILMIAGNLSEFSISDSINKHFSSDLLSSITPFYYPRFHKSQCVLKTVNYTPEQNRWLVSPYKVEDPRYNSFEDIPLHDKEEKVIEKLMHCLASSSVPKLIWKQNDLQKMGKAINHIHPLKFISHIINQPILRSDLQEVHRNYFKWRGFLDGFRRRMTEEFYKGTLKDLIPGFAQSVDVRPEIVEHFVERRDWEGLVKSILY